MRDTIDMAREAGIYNDCDWRYEMKAEGDSLQAFEALVRADEREAIISRLLEIGALEDGAFIEAIRARGNT
jgi:hypothetical protein